MKKDVILALFVGFFIGGSIAVLAVKLPTFMEKQEKKETISKKETVKPSVITQNGTTLDITEPKNESIIPKTNVTISGKINPPSALIIETQLESIAVESGKDGTFSADIKLKEGGNPVYITTITGGTEGETKILNLYHTTENL